MGISGARLEAQSSGAGESWERRTTTFLEADTILDLKLHQRELEPYLFSLLDEAWKTDRDLIAPFFLKTEQLIRFEQREAGGWFRSMWNGWTVLAEIARRYNQSLEGIHGVGVYTRLFREDSEGVFPNGSGFLEHNHRAVFQKFLVDGGNYEVPGAMDRMSEALREACGDGELFPLLPLLSEFCGNLRPAQQKALMGWAEGVEKGDEDGDREFAGWVKLGCQVQLLEEGEIAGPNQMTPSEVAVLESRLSDLISNDSISPAWRQGCAAWLSSTLSKRMGDELRLEIGKLSAANLQNDIPFSSLGMTKCLWAFLEVKEVSDDWRKVASSLGEGWKHRNRYNGESKSTGLALDPSRLTIGGMMEVACRAGDEELIDWNLKKFSETRSAFPGMLVSLVAAGYYRQAEELLLERGSEVRFRSDHYLIGPRFSRRLQEKTPAFLKRIYSPDWRNYAGLLLAATPDPNPETGLEEGVPVRYERVEVAAKPIYSRPIRVKQLRVFGEDVISTIHGGESLVDVLNKPTAHFFEEFETVESLDSAEVYWLSHKHFYEAMHQLSKGESFPAHFTWGRIVFEEHENSRDLRRNAAEAVVDMLQLWIRDHVLRDDKETLRNLLPFGRQVMGTVPIRVYREDVSELQNVLLVAHAHLGEAKAYERWWESLTEDRKDFLAELLYDEMGLFEEAGQLLNPTKKFPGDRFIDVRQRQEQFLSLVSNPCTHRGYARRELLGRGCSMGLILEEDLEHVARESAIRAPRGGSAIREWLGWMSDSENLEEVLVQTSKVLADPEWRHLTEAERFAVKMEKAVMEATLGEKETARNRVSSLDENVIELPVDLNSYFVGLKKRFDIPE